MITYNWNKEKNLLLKRERDLSFEQIILHIENGDLLVIKIEEYIISVPFVENGNERFLKTIIPSRKLTKKYLKDSK